MTGKIAEDVAGAGARGGGVLALQGGRLLNPAGEYVDGGTILIKDGKIQAAGKDLRVPAGARVLNLRGRVVTPGFIDAHSHLGLYGEPSVWATLDANEITDPITPHLRGIDSFNPDDPAFGDVVSAGVSAVYTGPGSANIIGGTGLLVKLAGSTVEEMRVPGVEHMKMALGENPKRVYGENSKKPPATRMGNAAALREALIKAWNYMEKMDRADKKGTGEDGGDHPERDLRWEMLAKVLRREMKARIHCHRSDDILTAIRIAEEFNLDFVLEHVTEGYKVAAVLAEKEIPCVVGPLLIPRSKMELKDIRLDNPARLVRAGVKVAIQADASSATRWLPLHAGVAVREGMPEEEALRAITLYPAQILGVEDRMGSLEPGRDADIAVFDGHPFSTYTHCMLVLIDGKVVFER